MGGFPLAGDGQIVLRGDDRVFPVAHHAGVTLTIFTEGKTMTTQTPEATETATETYEVEGDNLVAKIKEIVREGNVRRIIIKNEEGKRLIEIPLTIGVVGAVLLPVWAAIAVIAAIVTSASIEVERVEQ